jgi:hypothetical protein
MRAGSIVLATEQGLGVLARSFYRAGVVTDVLVVPHKHRPNHYEWYPGAQVFDERSVERLVRDVDALLFFETPFHWGVIPVAREAGRRTHLMTMYECEPKALPYQPDRFLCPSLLDLQYYQDRSTFLPVPVEVPWRQRTEARVFVHNAGNGGLRGRNGTRELLAAMEFVRSPIRLIVRAQKPSVLEGLRPDPRVELRPGSVPYETLWDEGDVLVHPSKFDGLSLPLQEARAAGMGVLTGDRFPFHCWLPSEGLFPVARYDRACISGRMNEFDEAVYDPRDIAAKIDEWYGRDLTQYSLEGRAWAEEHSWARLRPKYLEALSA